MIRIALKAEIREAEQKAIENGIPSITLMERAGSAVADRAVSMLRTGSIAVFCGAGSNGGDGFIAARRLRERNLPAVCLCVCSPGELHGDAAEAARRFTQTGGMILPITEIPSETGLIVDALLGTGVSRETEGIYAQAVDLINASGLPVLSVDLPSGLMPDGETLFDRIVRADATVTFMRPRPAHFLQESTYLCGEVVCADIGVSDDCFTPSCNFFAMDKDTAIKALPDRPPVTHKGHYGKLLLVCGAEGYTGAAVMAARAAQRSGAGLVYLGVPRCIYPIVAAKLNETVVFPLPCADGVLSADALPELLRRAETADLCLAGCGLGAGDGVKAVILGLTERAPCPLILDADGINAFVRHIHVLKKASKPPILTPHMGELARLLGENPVRSGESSWQAAVRISRTLNAVLVMKGNRTITADPQGRVFINTTGNAGMARGGSGDVLSGMAAALCAVNSDKSRAAASAVFFHGRAGDLCAARLGKTAMLPSDMIDALPEAFYHM